MEVRSERWGMRTAPAVMGKAYNFPLSHMRYKAVLDTFQQEAREPDENWEEYDAVQERFFHAYHPGAVAILSAGITTDDILLALGDNFMVSGHNSHLLGSDHVIVGTLFGKMLNVFFGGTPWVTTACTVWWWRATSVVGR